VIAKNDEPALAQKLAAFLLSPSAQAKALQGGASIPANPKTPLPADTDVLIKHAVDYARTAVNMDWDVINAQRPTWSARWNKTVER
jgi:putative spermidine/putrescine transport system substrate-binding protein